MATPVWKTFTTYVELMQQRRHRETAHSLFSCIILHTVKL